MQRVVKKRKGFRRFMKMFSKGIWQGLRSEIGKIRLSRSLAYKQTN